MTAVRDPKTDQLTMVMTCRSCHRPVYFSYTAAGKACPYNVTDDGEPTEVSHFTTCPDAKHWSKRV